MRRLHALGLFLLLAALQPNAAAQTRLRFIVSSACPGCIPIQTTDTANTIIGGQPAGTTFLVKSGIHRFDSINPRAGDTYRGEAGAILSGARQLHTAADATLGSFAVSGLYWRIGGQTQPSLGDDAGNTFNGRENGEHCQSIANGYPVDYLGCSYREELFMDDVLKTHVTTLAQLGPGKFFFDYAADFIYVGDNPTSKNVETSITTAAFNPTANNVTIWNLTIEKYAGRVQYGAINAEGTSGWSVTDSLLRWNHSGAIRIGSTMNVATSVITQNGEIGIVGVGTDTIIENNEISYNNASFWDQGWEGGGTKFVSTVRLIVRGNFSHHNIGPGLWTDIDNINTLYENNTSNDNQRNGIHHEISEAAIIRNNTILRNGFQFPDWGFGAGILIAGSNNVEVYGNTVQDCADGIMGLQQARGSGAYGPHEINNLYVHDNTIRMATGSGWTGLVQDLGDLTYFNGRNNRFQGNTYQLQGSTNYFSFMNGDHQSFAVWQAGSGSVPTWAGQDSTGSATVY